MAILVVHCGAQTSDTMLDVAELALDEGLAVLRAGGDAMDAVTRAVSFSRMTSGRTPGRGPVST